MEGWKAPSDTETGGDNQARRQWDPKNLCSRDTNIQLPIFMPPIHSANLTISFKQ